MPPVACYVADGLGERSGPITEPAIALLASVDKVVAGVGAIRDEQPSLQRFLSVGGYSPKLPAGPGKTTGLSAPSFATDATPKK